MAYYLTNDELYHSLIQSQKYGVPEQKKFPLFDLDHVKSAIKFFNYVDPKYEDQLAKAILKRAKEYGLDLSEMSIGDNNRFKKYLPNDELKHHGILGQKWGVRRYQNEDGSYTEAGKKRKAHEYTKELNSLSRNQARSLAKIAGINRWNDLDRLSYKIKKQTEKQQLGKSNQKKIDRLTKKLNKKKLRVEELKNEYTNSKQKIDKLIKSVSKNKDFVYKTSPMYIGTNGNWFTNESWYQTVWGTKYKVKTATDKRKKSIKWTERHSEYPIVPVHTTYYYY